MSLPRELLDELLSRYMDGELSADELARVEQILSTDAEALAALNSLRASCSLVRKAIDTSGKLRGDFASRVFEAAAVEAENVALQPDHPLMLAKSASQERGRGSQKTVYAALLALAASLVLAVFVATRDSGNDAPLALIDDAANGNQQVVEDSNAIAGDNLLADEGIAASSESSGSAKVSVPSVPESAAAQAGPMLADSGAATGSEVPTAGGQKTDQRLAADMNRSENGSTVSADTTLQQGNFPEGMGQLRAVMVYEVYITERGRETNIVGRIFKSAGVRMGDERAVDENLVGHLRASGLVGAQDSELADGEAERVKRCQIIFLEGSGVAMDRAMMGLMAAEGDVSKVGFNLMMNPPVMAAIDELKVADPRMVRSAPRMNGQNIDGQSVDSEQPFAVAQSLSPNGYDGSLETSFAVGNQNFVPIDAQQAGMLSQFSAFGKDPKTDIKSHVLMIVRFE